jgi:glucose-6-phosphate dehydrogenase assembly protein OpcA
VSAGSLGAVVDRVEAELNAFWATPDVSGGAPVAKVRAATMTFVVVAHPRDLARLRTEARALSETHPARAFLLTVDGSLPAWEASTDVDAVCQLGGPVALCHDRVEITFGALAAERAASVVGALALPEVPLVLEVGPDASPVLVEPLIALAQRVIVDTDRLPIDRAAGIARRTTAPIADRAFVRTFTWRELVARFFDPSPEALRRLRRVEVRRTPSPTVEPAALLIGWLASRVGLELRGRRRATYADGSGVELAVLDDARADVGPGTVTAVRIEAELDGRNLHLACEREPSPDAVRSIASGARSEAHEHRFGRRDETWVLTKAIDSTEQDRVYREALSAASAWSRS